MDGGWVELGYWDVLKPPRAACYLCVLSPKDTRPNQDSPSAGSALPLSKQQVAPIRREGHSNALMILDSKEKKMKRNIVGRDFVFRL